MNFEYFRETWDKRFSKDTIFHSELEEHPFDNPPLPLNGDTTRHIPKDVECRAAGSSEERPGQSSICPLDAVSSEQVAVRARPESSNEQSSQQRETCLANPSPGHEIQAIEAATIQRGGPALSEDGLNCTPEETTHSHGASSGFTPRAHGGEASQGDGRSVSSSASERIIIYTPRSSSLGSEYGDPANGDLDTADVENNVHFDHVRAC